MTIDTVVIDNAPAHCKAEEIVEANPCVQVIRLGPYSPALNGIEACWSVVKSAIKRQPSAHQQELFEARAGTTQVAHKLRIMREIAMLNFIPCWSCAVIGDLPRGGNYIVTVTCGVIGNYTIAFDTLLI